MDLAQPERKCVLSNVAVFAQLERVPRVISAGSRVWHCRAHLQYKPAEESLDAYLSLSFLFSETESEKACGRKNIISAVGRHSYQLRGGMTWLSCCSGIITIHKKAILYDQTMLLNLIHWALINYV